MCNALFTCQIPVPNPHRTPPPTMTSTEAATATVEADTANLNMSPSRRPNDVALTQQRMKTWQPLLSPRWVIAAYFIIAVIFIPAGELFALKIQRK